SPRVPIRYPCLGLAPAGSAFDVSLNQRRYARHATEPSGEPQRRSEVTRRETPPANGVRGAAVSSCPAPDSVGGPVVQPDRSSTANQQIERPKIAVVGAGLMGHGIAQVFAEAGYPVALHDPEREALATVPAR